MGCGGSKEAHDGGDARIRPAANYQNSGPPPQMAPQGGPYEVAQPQSAAEVRRQKMVKGGIVAGIMSLAI
ncbi:hypothetical protein E4U13_002789 [Claviceps humidiphila]|uniref:Uncharacterized protein n=2 Tax=Claviceps TaxID=5110 RepID=A0A9P7MP60_9HYPO|nr:hypothetical protein E4U57_003373 [Claviceps arundinis]KAG5962604.1 hypothetical protein E4U56_003287 [Claviceps arundinis]KAG6115402.1 hypothetical protein E4U13_002789 [Claviceps humidiphila]